MDSKYLQEKNIFDISVTCEKSNLEKSILVQLVLLNILLVELIIVSNFITIILLSISSSIKT